MIKRSLLALIVSLTLFSAAQAEDRVVLVNGDTLSGAIVQLKDQVLTLQTGYAGTLEIDPAHLQSLLAESPLYITLADGSRLFGTIQLEEKLLSVTVDGETQQHPLNTVKEISTQPPLPAEAPPTDEPPQEEAEEEPKARLWSGSIDAGLSLRSGNTSTTDFNLGANARRTQERHTLTLSMSAAYGEAEDVLNTRKGQLTAKWQVYPRERFYYFGLGDLERDDGRKLDLRLRGGLGLGYDVLKSEKRTLSLDASLNYTHETWNPFTPSGRESTKSSNRAAARDSMLAMLDTWVSGTTPGLKDLDAFVQEILEFKDPLRAYDKRKEDFMSLALSAQYQQPLFARSKLEEALEIHPNLDELGEFRLISKFALTTPLSEVLNLKVSVDNEYDSQAERSDVDAWDTSILTTLQYSF